LRNRAVVEVMISQDEVDGTVEGLVKLLQTRDQVSSVPDVPRDQESVGLRAGQVSTEELDVGFVEEVQVQVGEPGELHTGILPGGPHPATRRPSVDLDLWQEEQSSISP